MRSEVRQSGSGPYLDLSHLFAPGVFAFVTLKGFLETDPEALRSFCGELGYRVLTVHRVEQIHSGAVIEASIAPCEADAIVGSARGEAVRVVTADCVPILLASSDGSRYAVVHAGWKGTLARIVQRAVRAMGIPPADLAGAIGPAIGPCCYGVDHSRYGLFESEFPGWLPPYQARGALDLQDLNRRQMEEAGISGASIHIEERCTACEVGLCCSYRRDGDRAGRMATLVGRTA